MTDGALLGTVIGGLIGFASAAGKDILTNRRESRALALSFRGAIGALVRIVEQRHFISTLDTFIEEIRSGKEARIFKLKAARNYVEIYSRNVDKLGALRGRLPEMIPTFYTITNSLLEDVDRLASGDWDKAGNEFLLSLYVAMRQMLAEQRQIYEAICDEIATHYPTVRVMEVLSAFRSGTRV